MKKYLLTSAAVALALTAVAGTAKASLIANGITYTLTENSISADDKTAFFTFTASGENTASDTEGGRTGVNAIAFNQPAPGTVLSGTMTSPSGFSFSLGGLNSSGCDGSGNFYCFDNTAIPPTPSTLLSGLLTFNFNVTSNTPGVWENYATDLKIDWVGTQNNYNLVSLPIGLDGNPPPPPPPPPPVPEPASLAIFGSALVGLGVLNRVRRWRSKTPTNV